MSRRPPPVCEMIPAPIPPWSPVVSRMNEPCAADRLIEHINRSAETLARSEQNMQTAHDVLQAAQRQLQRPRALPQTLSIPDQVYDVDAIQNDTHEPSSLP